MTARIDISGQVFGHWQVHEYAANRKYRCVCSCGVEKYVESQDLRRGATTSCGHAGNGSNNFQDLTGRRFGELEVLSYAGKQRWNIRCSCGVEKDITAYQLKKGGQTDCGHVQRQKVFDATEQLVGEKIYLLTVLRIERPEKGAAIAVCACACGNEYRAEAAQISFGAIKSCGCYNTLMRRQSGKLAGERLNPKKSHYQCSRCKQMVVDEKFNRYNNPSGRSRKPYCVDCE